MPLDWGGTTKKGFTPVARAFLRHYIQLGISMEEAMLILHVLDYAWCSTLPFPKVRTLCQYTGKTDKTIRNYLRSLRIKGFLKTRNRGGRSNEYDFSPLFERLRSVSDIPEAKEEVAPHPQAPLEDVPDVNESGLTDLTTQDLHTLPTQEKPIPYNNNNEEEKITHDPLRGVLDTALLSSSRRAKGRKPANSRVNTQGYKRLRKFLDKSPKNYNCNDMELVLAHAWKSRWDKVPPPRFTGRDRKHAKDLIEHYGAAETAKVINTIVVEWETYSAKFSLGGYPSMPLFWGYRNSLFPLVLQGDSTGKPLWGTHFKKEDSRSEGDEVGW